jgi:hypothetical protein
MINERQRTDLAFNSRPETIGRAIGRQGSIGVAGQPPGTADPSAFASNSVYLESFQIFAGSSVVWNSLKVRVLALHPRCSFNIQTLS